MPKSRTARDSTEQKSPVLVVRDAADAMFRAAAECCHQHDEHLDDLSAVYQQTAASIVPTGDDAEWWHRANALWLASREYLRRSGGCETETKNLKEHSAERLNELHTEYELEASALLALKHAADAYRRSRPTAA
jgi:hypothetical protein